GIGRIGNSTATEDGLHRRQGNDDDVVLPVEPVSAAMTTACAPTGVPGAAPFLYSRLRLVSFASFPAFSCTFALVVAQETDNRERLAIEIDVLAQRRPGRVGKQLI